MNLKDLSYQGNQVVFAIRFGGIDVYDYIDVIGNLSKSLNYPDIDRIRVGEVELELTDEEGFFASDNANNFFGQNNLPNGVGTEVEIDIGFKHEGTETTETIFKGKILENNLDTLTAIRTITVTDQLHDLWTEEIRDFGIEKTFKIVSNDRLDQHETYTLAPPANNLSSKSVSVNLSSSEDLNEAIELPDRGVTTPHEFQVLDNVIKTTDGVSDEADEDYPRVTGKSPYRYRDTIEIISLLLNEAGILDREIILPTHEIGNNFSGLGRPGYETAGTEPIDFQNELSWRGFITDIFEDNTGHYYCVNNPLSDYDNTSRIIRKAPDGRWSTIFASPSSRAEFWGITKDGNNIYVLTTRSNQQDIVPQIQVPPKFRMPTETRVQVKVRITGSPTNVEVSGYRLLGQNRTFQWDYNNGIVTIQGTTGANELENARWTITAERGQYKNEADVIFDIDADAPAWSDIEAREARNKLPDLTEEIPELNSYNAVLSGNGNFILSVDISDESVTTIVPTNATLKPQIAHFMQLGDSINNEDYSSVLADSRRNFQFHNGYLYYPFVQIGTPHKFGVAKVQAGGTPTAVIRLNSDGVTHLAFDFVISGNQIILAYTKDKEMRTSVAPA